MDENSELDYQDENGVWHIMCACGHTVSGAAKLGDKIATCPNCRFRLAFGSPVMVMYPERLPDDLDVK